jgi:Tfp pilus assembly protein PilZ
LTHDRRRCYRDFESMSPHQPADEIPPDILNRLRVPLIRKMRMSIGDRNLETLTIDVGLRGVFAEWSEMLAIDERVEVEFTLPQNELAVKAVCRVAWCHQPGTTATKRPLPPGLGLEFVEIDEQARERVRGHILEYCRRYPKARQFTLNWPEDADSPWGVRA